MKNIKLSVLILIMFTCFFSCSDGGEDINSIPDSEEETNNTPDNKEDTSNTSQYLFFKPYIEWGSSKAQVDSKMKDCTIISDTDNMLCYQSEGETIAYAFKNDQLHTIVVIPKKTLSLDDILSAFNSYTSLNKYDNLVYLDKKSNTIAEIENSNGFYTIGWSQYGLDMATAVDLGLSVKWSNVNLDIGYDDYAALTPENSQDKNTRSLNGLIGWGDPTGEKKSKIKSDYPQVNSISGTIYDVAKSKWGGKWRIATMNEFQELLTACIWTWEVINERYGYRITGPNGNSIFLPASGYRNGDSYYNVIEEGFYWTGNIRGSGNIYPYALIFDKAKKGLNIIPTNSGLAYPYKYFGCAIRPVQDK